MIVARTGAFRKFGDDDVHEQHLMPRDGASYYVECDEEDEKPGERFEYHNGANADQHHHAPVSIGDSPNGGGACHGANDGLFSQEGALKHREFLLPRMLLHERSQMRRTEDQTQPSNNGHQTHDVYPSS